MAEDIVYGAQRPRYDPVAEARKAQRMQQRMRRERPYIPEYDAGPARRENWNVMDYNWASPGNLARHGTTQAELQDAYAQLSDVDRIRADYLGPTGLLQMAGARPPPVPGAGAPRPPLPPPSPFDPSYDPLPVPPTLPPENPPVAPAPPEPPWIGTPTPTPPPPVVAPGPEPPVPSPAPAPAPPVQPPTTVPAPVPSPAPAPAPPVQPPTTVPAPAPLPPPSVQPPAQPTPAPVGGTGTNVGPGPYPPWLGGQPTWGNPTDPYLLPFSPGSILPPGQGGRPPSWWNEIIDPYRTSAPGTPTTYNNPYLGNTGGFSVGSPYFAPFSSWGFYPMAHMAQHMPGSFGMATPGMGSWYTGSPVGFNPMPGTVPQLGNQRFNRPAPNIVRLGRSATNLEAMPQLGYIPTPVGPGADARLATAYGGSLPSVGTPIGAPQAYSTPPQGPTAATNSQTTGMPATSWTGVNAMPTVGVRTRIFDPMRRRV